MQTMKTIGRIPSSSVSVLGGEAGLNTTLLARQPVGCREPFCVELSCSPNVCVGFLQVLSFPPTAPHATLYQPPCWGGALQRAPPICPRSPAVDSPQTEPVNAPSVTCSLSPRISSELSSPA
ncbi:unnamed protein product [Pleuronectes platessa]|uniref:Uncharacterized protein n=1 Tax=Pleuronectes platessa TaxID=8262 RepID=A0A9N7YMP3_PLEPL|nr:unnamed protein product [Pleuronectes platessa]